MRIFAFPLKLFSLTFRRYNEFFVLQSKLKEFHGRITILFEGIHAGPYPRNGYLNNCGDQLLIMYTDQILLISLGRLGNHNGH